MRHPAVRTLLLTAVLAPMIASAQPTPSLKSGLWKMAMQPAALPNHPDRTDGMVQHSEICLAGPLTPEQLRQGRPASPKMNCTTIRKEQTSDVRFTEQRCVRAGHTTEIVTTLKESKTHFDLTSVLQMDGGPKLTTHATMDWAGDCPAGMKVGQFQFQRPATP